MGAPRILACSDDPDISGKIEGVLCLSECSGRAFAALRLALCKAKNIYIKIYP